MIVIKKLVKYCGSTNKVFSIFFNKFYLTNAVKGVMLSMHQICLPDRHVMKNINLTYCLLFRVVESEGSVNPRQPR